MAPVFLVWMKNKTPISTSLFGKNKTVQGFVSGVLLAIITVWLQKDFANVAFLDKLSLIDYSSQSVVVLGSLFGCGALGGDAIESYFKRRRGIPPGGRFEPWDQLDFLIGASVLVALFVPPQDWWPIGIAIAFTPILHRWACIVGYRLGLKAVPY